MAQGIRQSVQYFHPTNSKERQPIAKESTAEKEMEKILLRISISRKSDKLRRLSLTRALRNDHLTPGPSQHNGGQTMLLF